MTRQWTHYLAIELLILVFGVLTQDTTTDYPTTTEPAFGCGPCLEYRCPNDPDDCLLGTVPDPCGCCGERGVCARLDGEPCWNASILELPAERRNEGLCARNYVCQLRTDLEPEDVPEATCVCMEQSLACGNDNRTYTTPCALREEAIRQKSSGLRLEHLGPCPSRPKIYTPPENIVSQQGRHVALSCEAKGSPLPEIFWEFRSADGRRVIRYPDEELYDAEVSATESDSFLRVSYLQLTKLEPRHAGIYLCVAKNTQGEASASSILTVHPKNITTIT